MNIYSIPDIFAFIFNLSLAIRVISQKGNGRIKYWLFSFLSLFALWNLTNLISLNVINERWVLLGAQFTYRILFLFPAFVLGLSLNFFNKLNRNQVFFRYFVIFFLPVLLLALGFPGFNFKFVKLSEPQLMYYYTIIYKPTLSFIGSLVLSIIYLSLSVVIIHKKENIIASVQQRKTFERLIYGLIILNVLFFLIYIPYFQSPSYSFIYLLRIGFLFVEIFFFYAIAHEMRKTQREHLPDKFLSYFIFTVLVALYFILIKVIIDLVDTHFHIHGFYFDAALIFILTIFFQPAESLIHQFVFHNLKNQLYQYRSNFLKLTNELMEMYPDEKLLEKVRVFILDNFLSEEVLLFRKNDNNEVFEEISLETEIPSDSELVNILQKQRKIVESVEIEQETNKLSEYFRGKDIRIFIPVMRGDELIMFFALGRKKNRKDYSLDEFDVLSIFSNEISLYLQRNIFFEKIQAHEREKFRLEKLAALGQLTAGIAHEIRNPLNTISTAAQTLMNKNLPEETKEQMARYIEEEVTRLSELINEFLELSRLRKPQYGMTDLQELLSKLSIFIRTKNSEVRVRITNNVNAAVYTDSTFLYQILSNLTLNALEAVDDYCKTKVVSCKDTLIAINTGIAGGILTLSVSNTGETIPETIRERIFEPFFTTKEQGTGLGLSLVENMVKALGGKINLISKPDLTQFLIKIPLKDEHKA